MAFAISIIMFCLIVLKYIFTGHFVYNQLYHTHSVLSICVLIIKQDGIEQDLRNGFLNYLGLVEWVLDVQSSLYKHQITFNRLFFFLIKDWNGESTTYVNMLTFIHGKLVLFSLWLGWWFRSTKTGWSFRYYHTPGSDPNVVEWTCTMSCRWSESIPMFKNKQLKKVFFVRPCIVEIWSSCLSMFPRTICLTG